MKLSCAVTRDLLPLYAENMVEQETKVLIEEHLNECDDCKKKLSEMTLYFLFSRAIIIYW